MYQFRRTRKSTYYKIDVEDITVDAQLGAHPLPPRGYIFLSIKLTS